MPKAPRAAALLVVLALALAGCLLAPGRFTSALDVRKDGRFSYTYNGEIHLLALSKLAEAGRADEKFEASPCYEDDGSKERTCTTEELATQKRQWEQAQASAADSRRRDAESMKAIMGGIDPSDPRAAEEFAARLRRQAGWRKVEYKGDGLFLVDFAITGRLDHDFTFPSIERFPLATPFVQLLRRQDGTVRMDAPAFAPASGGEPFRSMASGMSSVGVSKTTTEAVPVVDGRFALTTDGEILANNTDNGPQADTLGKRMDWTVNLRSPAAPMALVKLAR